MSVILCTAGYDHTIRFWEALSGLCSRQIPHTDSQINRLCISPNKAFLAVAGRFKVYLYSCRLPDSRGNSTYGGSNSTQDSSGPLLTFEGHTNNITGVAFHIDTKWMVTSSEDHTVRIWDTKTGSVQRNYNHGCPVNDVVIHPNQGELISCDRGGNIRIWDLGENKCTHQLVPEPDISVSSITVAADGSLLCAGNNIGNVYVWRLLQNETTTLIVPLCRFSAHTTYITRVLLSPDVRVLATCSADHTARIWRVETSFPVADPSPEPHNSNGDTSNGSSSSDLPPTSPTSSAEEEDSDDSIHSASDYLYSDDELEERQRIRAQQRQRSANATRNRLLQDTSTATSTYATNNTNPHLQHTHAQQLPNPNTAPPPPPQAAPVMVNRPNQFPPAPAPYHFHQQNASSAANSPAGAGKLGGKDTPHFPLECTLHEHQRWVWDCAFSADSAYLVTACSDHYARLWDLSERVVIRQYQGHHRGLVCVALNDYSAG